MPTRSPTPHGFTTIEVMVALVLTVIALIALAGTTTYTFRQLIDTRREQWAVELAQQRRERAIGAVCATGAGTDSTNAVALRWTTNSNGGMVSIAQDAHYPAATVIHYEQFQSLAKCH